MRRTLLLTPVVIFFIFFISGFFFSSAATRGRAEFIWLSTLAIISLTITVTVISYAVIFLRGKSAELHKYTPDENGNFPIAKVNKHLMNLNLLGAEENGHAWAFWQATNHKALGTPARELFNRQPLLATTPAPPLQLVTEPGESDVIDAVAEEL